MKIVVDYQLCEGNQKCEQAAPELFHVDEEDDLHVKIESPGEEHRAKLEAAVRACPKRAIKIVED